MKVNNLKVKSFRNYQMAILPFAHINFVLGLNNSGKSSIKGALQYALTGTNEWTGSRNMRKLIRFGETKAIIETDIEDIGVVRRTIGKQNQIHINRNIIIDRELEKIFIEQYGFDYNAIRCALDSAEFLDMNSNDQKDFIFRLTGAVLDTQQIISFMDNPSQTAKDEVISLLENEKKVTTEVLDSLYKEVFSLRKIAKKERDSLGIKLKNITVKDCNVDIKKLEEKTEIIDQRRDSLLKKIAVINEKTNQRKALKTYLEKTFAKIEQLKKQLDTKIDLANAEKTISEMTAEISLWENDIEKNKKIANTIFGQNESLKSILAKLNTTKCPLSDKIVCGTDKSSLIKDLQEHIANNNEQINNITKIVKKLTEKLNARKLEKEKIEAQLKIVSDLKAYQEQEKQYKENLKNIGKVEDEKALKTEFETCETQKRELSKRKLRYREWEQKRKEKEDFQKKLTEQENKVNMYEYLAKEFSSKGVKSRILKKIVDPIEHHCNERLAILTEGKYKIRFDFSNNFDIIVENEELERTPLNSLSASEKFRIGVVFQDTINNLTNVRILFVDSIDILDDKNMELFYILIDKIKDSYDTIFIASTEERDNVCNHKSKFEDSKVYFIENGKVVLC
ncbi:MAG: hypothetical protein PHN69_06010 [Candidatus Pacebacteria bacterium]|nr:hypothetical protein [Candidatus Paceibacterota bacterium]